MDYPLSVPSYDDLLQENFELRRLVREQQAQILELQGLVGKQQEIIARQERRIAELERQIDDLRRQGKRQAAPFSKGEPSPGPKPPGRKAGMAYGRQAVRGIPKHIDERSVAGGCRVAIESRSPTPCR
jgi:hypothetical protein